MPKLDIVVIRLPRISNFTDFDPLFEEEDVMVRYVTTPSEWGNPDAVILPGSKNTVEDLLFLREIGLEARILEFVRSGGRLTGICAGYQMMGERLLDPQLIESDKLAVDGLALLPTETTFTEDKKTELVEGFAFTFTDHKELPIEGYEIHMGRTRFTAEVVHPFQLRLLRHSSEIDQGYHPDGVISEDGKLWGTYVHGVLHNDDFRRSWLNQLRSSKGWPAVPGALQFQSRREHAFDRLAEHVRTHLDMAKIYEMIQITKRGQF
jgi:cobyric acid synthase